MNKTIPCREKKTENHPPERKKIIRWIAFFILSQQKKEQIKVIPDIQDSRFFLRSDNDSLWCRDIEKMIFEYLSLSRARTSKGFLRLSSLCVHHPSTVGATQTHALHLLSVGELKLQTSSYNKPTIRSNFTSNWGYGWVGVPLMQISASLSLPGETAFDLWFISAEWMSVHLHTTNSPMPHSNYLSLGIVFALAGPIPGLHL